MLDEIIIDVMLDEIETEDSEKYAYWPTKSEDMKDAQGVLDHFREKMGELPLVSFLMAGDGVAIDIPPWMYALKHIYHERHGHEKAEVISEMVASELARYMLKAELPDHLVDMFLKAAGSTRPQVEEAVH